MAKNLFFLLLFICSVYTGMAQVGVNNPTPNEHAALDVVATGNDKGILIPRLTTQQRDDNIEDNDPGTLAPSTLQSGTMIYNTDLEAFQYWKGGQTGVWETVGTTGGSGGVDNEGVVVMDFPTPINIGLNANFAIVQVSGPIDTVINGVRSVKSLTPETREVVVNNDFGNEQQLVFNEVQFEFNTDATFWPENAPSILKDAIWNETDEVIYENPIVGQVHGWRITFRYQKASKDATVQVTMRNPDNGFEVNGQHRASEVDLGGGNYYQASVFLITIADNNSLPSSLGGTGTGNGYEIYFRANGEIDIEVTKITRISYKQD